MKISILTPDLSHNCLSRAHLLAGILGRQHHVEIVGPALGGGIWQPLADERSVEFRMVAGSISTLGSVALIRGLCRAATGAIVYASKPLVTSYGVGLIHRHVRNKPLVLDIDDWQGGFQRYRNSQLTLGRRLRRYFYSMMYVPDPGGYINNVVGEKLTRFADEITVSNSFLQNRFGGTIIWHAKDTTEFDPGRFDRNEVRQRLRIGQDARVIMFLGTTHDYKGLEDLIAATSLIEGHRVLLMIVGLGCTEYCHRLEAQAYDALGAQAVRIVGPQPFKEVPQFLAASDLVAVPQRRTAATVGQLPIKIFEAMAMAKPIVTTAVSDIPHIIDECGWVVPPDVPVRLAEALQYVLDHPDEAEARGRLARERCKARYSWDAMETPLLKVFAKYQ